MNYGTTTEFVLYVLRADGQKMFTECLNLIYFY